MRVDEPTHGADARAPEGCRWRIAASHPGGEVARCRFLQQLFGAGYEGESEVTREACVACCQSFPPSFEMLNPVVASLLFDRIGRIADAADGSDRAVRLRSLQQWAERHLEIDAPPLPTSEHRAASARHAPVRPLIELLPPPATRCGDPVRHWAVGVTTAPRRRSHLGECLDSLAEAGWPRPHLFVDGVVGTSSRWSHLPMTTRDEQLGAWPNYYLSLFELAMREPLADAFLMVQDDALFYCRENVRQYLERILWPGDAPGIVTLYCATPSARDEAGWFEYPDFWNYSSIALVFPREVVQRLLVAPSVFQHRWLAGDLGKVGIPDVIAGWAAATGTPIYVPSPSLTQHIGETSAIWLGAYELCDKRRASCFLEDVAAGSVHAWPEAAAADFPEEAFPCAAGRQAEYDQRVALGRRRMAEETAVICGLCRDGAQQLAATIPRIERLAGMFRQCDIVVYESDSTDGTPELLRQWASAAPGVALMSERLEQPRYRGTIPQRTELMAYYRNRCRERVLADFGDRRYALVVDMDLDGGWSFDGVANSFGHDDWDFIGSNGMSFASPHDLASYEHVDAFAYRAVGQARHSGQAHTLHFDRGEPLVSVWSCFGGLGVYRMECLSAAAYAGHDCEHVTFHQCLRERGFGRLFLNPSQIVLYSPWSDRA